MVDTGDVIFYDWNGDGTMDHAAIQVGMGSTSDGRYGNYIDQHTSPRHHSFWSGASFNTHISMTKYVFYVINN